MKNQSSQTNTEKSIATALYNAAVDGVATFVIHYSFSNLMNRYPANKIKQAEIIKSSTMYAISNIPKTFFSYYDQKYIGAALSALLKYNPKNSFLSLTNYLFKEISYVYIDGKSENIENPYLKAATHLAAPLAIEFLSPLPFDIYKSFNSNKENFMQINSMRGKLVKELETLLETLKNGKSLMQHNAPDKKALQKITKTNQLLKNLFDRNDNIKDMIKSVENFLKQLNTKELNKDKLFEIIKSIENYTKNINSEIILKSLQTAATNLKNTEDFKEKVSSQEINNRVEKFIESIGLDKLTLLEDLAQIAKLDKAIGYLSYYREQLSKYSIHYTTHILSPTLNNLFKNSSDTADDLANTKTEEDDLELIGNLLNMFYGTNITNYEYYNLTNEAIKLSDISTLKALLSYKKARNKDPSGEDSLIKTAISSNNYEALKLLIDNGNKAYLNYVNQAIVNGNVDIIKLLVENGATITEVHPTHIDKLLFGKLLLILHSPITATLEEIDMLYKYAEKYIEGNKDNSVFLETFSKEFDPYSITENIISNQNYTKLQEPAQTIMIVDTRGSEILTRVVDIPANETLTTEDFAHYLGIERSHYITLDGIIEQH